MWSSKFTLRTCNFRFQWEFTLKIAPIDSSHHCAFSERFPNSLTKFCEFQILIIFGAAPPLYSTVLRNSTGRVLNLLWIFPCLYIKVALPGVLYRQSPTHTLPLELTELYFIRGEFQTHFCLKSTKNGNFFRLRGQKRSRRRNYHSTWTKKQ